METKDERFIFDCEGCGKEDIGEFPDGQYFCGECRDSREIQDMEKDELNDAVEKESEQ